jgi:biopolymer transport protein ExbB
MADSGIATSAMDGRRPSVGLCDDLTCNPCRSLPGLEIPMMIRRGRRLPKPGALMILACTALLVVAANVLAQAPAPATDAQPQALRRGIDMSTGALPTLIDLFMTSPVVNGIIAVLSVISLMMFLYFLLTINGSGMAPSAFVDDVNKLILSKRYDEAATLCRSHRRIFVASIVQRCLENAGKGHSVIMDMLDAEGRRRADILWNRISYLADISNVAPMLGLFGTVTGMIKAFFSLQTESASINSKLLATGVGEAMSTTMFGLMVAISSLVFYSIVKSRATQALSEAEQIAHSIADHIKRGGA